MRVGYVCYGQDVGENEGCRMIFLSDFIFPDAEAESMFIDGGQIGR